MVDWTDRRIPAPDDWQAFERLCHRLWTKIWKDPDTQMNGRSGQAQYGVDVFGRPSGTSDWAGVQCKGKDGRYGKKVTEKELRAEVEKAKGFIPKLKSFTLATTAENDAPIQKLARDLTELHHAQGMFSVQVLGWREIVSRLSDHYPEGIEQLLHLEASASLLPELATDVRKGIEGTAQISESLGAISNQIMQLSVLTAQAIAAPSTTVAHAKLDQCRDLLREHSPRAALRLLERLRDEKPAPPLDVQFRIHTNIGAAHLALGDFPAAADEFLAAYVLDSMSDKAAANRVLALLLLRRPAEAREAAQAAISAHPSSALAWAAWINATARDGKRPTDPTIPEELLETVEILFALGSTHAIRGEYEHAESLLRRALTLDPDDAVILSRLADVLLMRGTSGGHIYLGSVYGELNLSRVREAADLLDRAWALLRDTELAGSNLSIPSNRAAIHLVFNQIDLARALVDDALPRSPNDVALLKLKIRLSVMRADEPAATNALNRLLDSDPEYPLLRKRLGNHTLPVFPDS